MSAADIKPPSDSNVATATSHLANLDPALQSAQPTLTLNSIGTTTNTNTGVATSNGVGGNPLNEFAQQVLGREDAENLLDFGRHGHSIGEEPSFGELLQAAGRGDGDEDAPSRTENDHQQHQHQQISTLEQHQQNQQLQQGISAIEHHHHEEQQGVGAGVESGDENALQQGRSVSGGIAQRLAKRKRAGEEGTDGEPHPLEPHEYARIKKDSHKEVERRRRENINDGINELAQLVPGGTDKQGKGTLLKRAAQHMNELNVKVSKADEEIAKREQEKQDLRMELAHVQTRLAEEHSRSLRYETSWREAEDRAASSQFELERVKAELEEAKAKLA